MDSNPEKEMSLVGHLTELRARLIISLVALAGTTVIGFFIATYVLHFLTYPITTLASEPKSRVAATIHVAPDGTLRINPAELRENLKNLSQKRVRIILETDKVKNLPEESIYLGSEPNQKLYYNNPLDPFMIPLKVAIVLGILLALPVILWQLWQFVSPGLKETEKKLVRPLIGGSMLLFPLGALFAYFMARFVLLIMQSYQVENIDPLLNVYSYISLLTTMMIVFGFVFEMPLFVALAARIGLVNPEFLKTWRRHAYVILAVAAMILTPTDGFTMLMCLGPMILLYELSIWLAIPMARIHRRNMELGPQADEEAIP